MKRLIKAALAVAGLEIRPRSRVNPWGYNPRRGDAFILAPLIEKQLVADGECLSVVDVGAGSNSDPFTAMMSKLDTATVYGFEVDEEECARVNAAAAASGSRNKYYPTALWGNTGKATAYLTRDRTGSSLYQPNVPVVSEWTYDGATALSNSLEVLRAVELQVSAMDDWARQSGINDVDFVKMNVQGGELEVLNGAIQSLPGVVGIQAEMSFNQTYVGAPKFAEVDQFLSKQGFEFFDALGPNYVGRANSPVTIRNVNSGEGFRWPSRQLFEGHFLYLRPHQGLSGAKRLKLALMAELYGQVEYAFDVLVTGNKTAQDIARAALPRYKAIFE